jgi:hypothetical protein
METNNTFSYKEPEEQDASVGELCECFRQEVKRILICAWSREKDDMTEYFREQEELRARQNRNYNPRPISHTICVHHRKKMEEEIQSLK